MNLIEPAENLIYIIIILVVAFILIRIISYLVNRIDKFKIDMTLVYLTRDIIQYIIAFIAILLVLDIFGINLTSIFVSLGIAGIAVGFAAKDIISNFMSGIILIADKNIKVDDVISINKYKGKIRKISFRHTKITTENGEIVTIPNQTLSNTPYIKYKSTEWRKISIPITIPLNVDINKFEEKILTYIKNMTDVKESPEPHIEAKKISEEGSEINLLYVLKTFKNKEKHRLNIIKESSKIIEELK